MRRRVQDPVGKKYDTDKPRYSLLPPQALLEVVKVLTFGAKKYGDCNWATVPNARDRYFSAAQRHLWDWFSGESTDEETGLQSLAHAACCILFLMALDFKIDKKK